MAESNVSIIGWPPEPARLEHQFDSGKSCPVTVRFESASAHVLVASSPDRPFQLGMGMNLMVSKALPIWIKLSEPICLDSDYTVGITLFDKPIVSISIKGRTRIFNSNQEL